MRKYDMNLNLKMLILLNELIKIWNLLHSYNTTPYLILKIK